MVNGGSVQHSSPSRFEWDTRLVWQTPTAHHQLAFPLLWDRRPQRVQNSLHLANSGSWIEFTLPDFHNTKCLPSSHSAADCWGSHSKVKCPHSINTLP